MRGGFRRNAGRKPGSGKYGEATKTMRVPASLEDLVRAFMELLCGLPIPIKVRREIEARIKECSRVSVEQ